MIKKTSSNQSCGRESECKMVRFLSPSVYFAAFHLGVCHFVFSLGRARSNGTNGFY